MTDYYDIGYDDAVAGRPNNPPEDKGMLGCHYTHSRYGFGCEDGNAARKRNEEAQS